MDRYNEGKAPLSLILQFDTALEDLSRVMHHSRENKYPDKDGWPNWKTGDPYPLETFLDSTLRHLKAVMNAEYFDSETGEPHLAHAAWNCLAACYHYKSTDL